MIKRICKSIVLTISIILVITIIGCKEHKRREEEIKFNDGSIVKIYHHYSKNKGFIIRDVMSVGGGNRWYEIRFKYKGKDFLWESKSRTFILNVFKNKLYTMIFDTETSLGEVHLRFFKYNNKWSEISAEEFPKEISIQNLYLKKNNGYYKGKPVNDYEIVKDLNTEDILFRGSLTAKLWLKLEKGTRYDEAPSIIDSKFLREYKRKYILKKE